MPVMDHCRTAARAEAPWGEFHAMWISNLLRSLNRKWLPPEFTARPEKSLGAEIRIDVGVVREPAAAYGSEAEGAGCIGDYLPGPPDATVPGAISPHARLLIRNGSGRLVGAIELVSPANKDRSAARDGFAARIQTYLQSQVALVVVDVVTIPRHNLHNRWVELFAAEGTPELPEGEDCIYGVSYRPYAEALETSEDAKIDLWLRPLEVGAPLPTVPLFIDADLAVPIELESTYDETCIDLRVSRPA